MTSGSAIMTEPLECVKKPFRRGDQWSPADFASQNLFAASENNRDFPLENPKIEDFRRAIKDRPYR